MFCFVSLQWTNVRATVLACDRLFIHLDQRREAEIPHANRDSTLRPCTFVFCLLLAYENRKQGLQVAITETHRRCSETLKTYIMWKWKPTVSEKFFTEPGLPDRPDGIPGHWMLDMWLGVKKKIKNREKWNGTEQREEIGVGHQFFFST